MRNNEQGGTFLGIFIGLALGLVIMAVIVWYTNQIPTPFTANKTQTARINVGSAPKDLPGKPGDIAPGNRAAAAGTTNTNTGASAAANTAAGGKTTASAAPGTASGAEKNHYLQAGSFSNPIEADNLKAKLAMQGMEVTVRQVLIQDKTFYRLVLGPYEKLPDLRRARAELASQGVETVLLYQE